MTEHSFTQWMKQEVYTEKYALLTLYEQQEDLKHIRGPQLEREYMEKIGSYEQAVILEEIECELLLKKKQMIQSAINRREPIDEDAIDAELGLLRQQMIEEACGPAGGSSSYGENDPLPPEQFDELQEIYRQIVENYHPQIHPELTEIQKELFKKAQEAYRRQDLNALRLIHDMLISAQGGGLEFSVEIGISTESSEEDPYDTTDYSLASLLYEQFEPTGEEAVIQEDRKRFRYKIKEAEQEISQMRLEFPFTAEELLADPAKIEEYKAELLVRMKNAETTRERREEEIQDMIKQAKRRKFPWNS